MKACYFDGRSAHMHVIDVLSAGSTLHCIGEQIDEVISKNQIRVDEPYENAPLRLELSNGAACVVYDETLKQSILKFLDYQESWVEHWQKKWVYSLIGTLLLVAVLTGAYLKGLPAVAGVVARTIPGEKEQQFGHLVLTTLDRQWLKPSKASDEDLEMLQTLFERIRPEANTLHVPIKIDGRFVKKIPNAFALPGGYLIVTDEMLDLIKDNGEWSPSAQAALMGVIAHEIGHIKYRHTMIGIVKSSILTAGVGALIGDFSGLAATLSTVALSSSYSQEAETQADDYAIELLQSKGIPVAPLAHAFERLELESKSNGKLPDWMSETLDYISSHPSTKSRIEKFRAADSK